MKTCRSLIVLFAAMILTASVTASAGEIKIALDCPPNASECGTYLWSSTFRNYLEARGLKVKLFERGALGGEAEKLDEVSQGLLEISNSDLAKVGSLDPIVFGFRLPFLFDNIDHLYRVIENTDIMEKINSGITPKHVRLLAIVPVGSFLGFATTKKLIKTPADLVGVRMRALDRAQAKWLELWGASAVIIPWSEIYNALQTGVCGGYMNSSIVPILFKHTDVLKYFSAANLAPALRAVIASEDWYEGLSTKDRVIVNKGVAQANHVVHIWANKSNQSALNQLKTAGLKVYINTPQEREAFAKLIRPHYAEIVKPEVAKLFLNLATKERQKK